MNRETFGYNEADWLTSTTQSVRPSAGGTAVSRSQTFTYTADGEAATFVHDGQTTTYTTSTAGWLTSVTDWRGKTTTTSYHPSGAPKDQVLGTNVANATFDWHADGMPKELRWRKGATVGSGDVVRQHTSIAYDVGGLRSGENVQILPKGSSTPSGSAASFGHDLLDRLTSWTAPIDDIAIAGRPSATYTLDDAGNITNETVTKVGGGSVRTITSTYTDGRLTQQNTTKTLPQASAESETYIFSGLGEETSRSVDPDAGGPDPAAVERTTKYDALGHTIEADDADSGDPDVTYVYDTADRLLSRASSSAASEEPEDTLHFYMGTSGVLVEETTGAGATVVRYAVSSDGEPMAQHKFTLSGHVPTGSGEWRWMLSDTAGNVATYLRDDGSVAEQAEWDPYGRPQEIAPPPGAGEKPTLGFQGAQTDPVTGSLVLGPRQYDPKTARFTTADSFVAGELDLELGSDALTGNRYLFAGANPTAFFEDGHGFFSKLVDRVRSPFRAIKRVARAALPALSFVPVVGTAIDTVSALTGRDWLNGGRKLSGGERALMLAGAALGLIPGVGLAGKAGLKGVAKLKGVVKLASAVDDVRAGLSMQRIVRKAARAVDDDVMGALTRGQRAALRKSSNPGRLLPMFRGNRIDVLARRAIEQHQWLVRHLTSRYTSGPDFTRAGRWWDMTTSGSWARHQRAYGGWGHGTKLCTNCSWVGTWLRTW